MEDKADIDSTILIAGHVVIDEIVDSVGQTVPRRSLGGPVSYSAVALSSLGLPPEIITKVGDDFPSQYSDFLRTQGGVEIDKFRVRNEKTTSFRIDRSIDPRRMWLLAKCKDLSNADFARVVSNADHPRALIINTVAGEISLSLLDKITKDFEYVFVDSQGFVRKTSKNNLIVPRSGSHISALSGVDFLKADRSELCAWTGLNDFESSLRQISKFVSNVIITSGRGQAEVYEGQKLRWRTRPLEVEIADTTGAGDIFLAVFSATFVESGNIKDSLLKSCCAASLALQRPGIEKAILDRKKIAAQTSRVRVTEY